ncbi:opioid growth factor receptor isoform X1 [Tachysurus fulvidraco]|uniref:opioid growth factor receptor isoform X1 n=1 Tax=Tachysurus fulvidraco TaxID=1234273 RepID=UPI001FEDA68F|nr:opioid growth factor receptor isoform X1 [Tachysurus fulvidraco]
MEDDLVCEYDSTWDTESDGDDLGTENPIRRTCPDKNKKAKAGFWSNSSSRNLRAAKDMQNYRHGYPNIIDEDCTEDRMPNLKFYLNEIKSSPDVSDVYIETFHSEWKLDYKRLERVHSYIQWLFPLREPGVNYLATELTKKEIQAFQESEEAKRRLVDSYELMLGFYGIQLTDRETGEVRRAENWRERFTNLERNMHNNLRITRILKSLGELGFEHYQAPLVHFFLEETLVKKNLSSVKRSVLDYFLFAVRNKHKRRELISYAFQHFEPKDKFVWCPRRIQKRFKKKAEAKRQDSPSRNKRDGEKREDDETISCEGSSVDPEPRDEGSSKEPLNNGNHLDNGEMDTSSGEMSAVKSDEDENQAKPAENTSSKSDQEMIRVKDDEEAKNISSSPKGTGPGKQVSESPKHSLTSSPHSERAGKLPRTKDNAGLGISDHFKSSEDAFNTSSPEKIVESDTKDGEKTNGTDAGEMMDTEPSGRDS